MASKKLFIKSAILANSILIITLSWIGLIDAQPFGVTPWKTYSASIFAAKGITDGLLSELNVTIYGAMEISNAPPFNFTTNALMENKVIVPIHFITNKFLVTIGTNTCVMRLSKKAAVTINEIQPIGHGTFNIFYRRDFDADQTTNVSTNFFGNVITSRNPFTELRDDLLTFKSYIIAHDKTKYIFGYSAAYFCLLISINTFLFIGSLVFCRITLREIVLSGRLFSAIALVITNITALLLLALSALLLMILLATPILWLLLPMVYRIAETSFYTFSAYFIGAGVTVWILSGMSAKLVVLIAFLPNLFAALVGGCSVLAIWCKKAFYHTVSGILIRCIENKPLTVILGTAVFIAGLIAAIAKLLHLSAFL